MLACGILSALHLVDRDADTHLLGGVVFLHLVVRRPPRHLTEISLLAVFSLFFLVCFHLKNYN